MKTLSTRARIVTGSAALVAVGAGAFGAVAAAAPDSGKPPQPAAAAAAKADVKNNDTFQTDHLTIDAATKAAQATLDAAKKANQRVSVAVVDRNGNTIVTLRGDGAGPQSYDAA
ncbi:heme-binding protein, partial [Yinghuangia aomiensis]|uniref:GlcG/HbpS family heme-binding protein n=1 Tax=Yinghuangia aomiensis TaxID=676205 RepID=UPI0031E9715E